MNKFYALLSVCLLLNILISCNGNGDSSLKTTDLVGTWECVGGSLDDEPNPPFAKTENAPGAIIEFTEEIMTFELLDQINKSKQQPYKLEESKILCLNDKELFFEIKEINSEEGKMVLGFSAEGHSFVMELERK